MSEIRDVRQDPNDFFRRCFSNADFDLTVWYRPDETIEGFELSYDKTGDEKAIRWLAGRGFSHHGVDSGEQSPLANRTPILRPVNAKPEIGRVLSSLEAADAWLPAHLRALVLSKLSEYGRSE